MGKAGERNELGNAPLILWRRWAPFAVILVLVFVVLRIDRGMKSGDEPGFALADAEWVIAADDVPKVWSGLLATDTWEALAADVGDPSRESLVELRKQFGMRLSPQRWGTWLGKGAVLSGEGDRWLLVTRPGVLMRCAMIVMPGKFTSADNAQFVWRNGYLCLTNANDVAAMVNEGEVQRVPRVGTSDGARVTLPEWYDAAVTIFARDGLPLEGHLALAVKKAPEDLSLKDGSGQGLIQIASTDPGPIIELLGELLPDWPNLTNAHGVIADWTNHSPDHWQEIATESVWSLDGFDAPVFDAMPLIEEAKLVEGSIEADHVLARTISQEDYEGYCAPWFGHTYERCLVTNGLLQRMSNHAEAFEAKDVRWEFGALDVTDVRVQIDPHATVEAFGELARSSATRGFIDGWSVDDVNDYVATLERRLRDIGHIVITGSGEGDALEIVGLLDVRDD